MLRILHTNDFHGTLDDAKQQILGQLRPEVHLYFDCGDCIKAGNLAIPLKPEAVWPRLGQLACTASVPGNRESHPLEGPFRKKIEGATHPILCANMTSKNGTQVLPPSMILEACDMRVGIFGVMVPMVTSKMAAASVSQMLWQDPIRAAEAQVAELRPQVDVLIALTHIGFGKDQKLAQTCPSIDLILGGHSHTVLQEPYLVGNVAICQAGSHGRYAGVYGWDGGLKEHRLVPLSPFR